MHRELGDQDFYLDLPFYHLTLRRYVVVELRARTFQPGDGAQLGMYMVNCLIHADYSDRAAVLVMKSPAGFGFRNPGLMRVPVDQALQGGASDCRNRTLHQIFADRPGRARRIGLPA